jgi:hypothetical protein
MRLFGREAMHATGLFAPVAAPDRRIVEMGYHCRLASTQSYRWVGFKESIVLVSAN